MVVQGLHEAKDGAISVASQAALDGQAGNQASERNPNYSAPGPGACGSARPKGNL